MPSKGNRKILFLPISNEKVASSRYRVYQYLSFLEKAGNSVQVLPPAEKKGRGLWRLLRGMAEESACLEAASGADIVFIQKRLFSGVFLRRLKMLGKKVVFDLDDSIFTSPKGSWSAVTRRKVLGRLTKTFEISDLVIAGNSYLRDYSLKAGARRVESIPTGLDSGKYRLKDHRQHGTSVLGWIGGSVNQKYLDLLFDVLPKLSGEFPGLKLLVISDKDYRMDGLKVENRRWSEETEVEALLGMDIGLMPLSDDEWTRGKCAFKALQYMACGIPAVCSPVGANKEIVVEGVNGCLPQGRDGWLGALRTLAADRSLRVSMGKAGRGMVERTYSLDVLAPKYLELLGSL